MKGFMQREIFQLVALLSLVLFLGGCERPEPIVVLKDPMGREAIVGYTELKDQPRYLRYKKSPYMRKKIAELKQRQRERQRGRFPRESRWDF